MGALESQFALHLGRAVDTRRFSLHARRAERWVPWNLGQQCTGVERRRLRCRAVGHCGSARRRHGHHRRGRPLDDARIRDGRACGGASKLQIAMCGGGAVGPPRPRLHSARGSNRAPRAADRISRCWTVGPSRLQSACATVAQWDLMAADCTPRGGAMELPGMQVGSCDAGRWGLQDCRSQGASVAQ